MGLTVIVDKLSELTELEELNLSQNPFKFLPANLQKLHKVQTLNLSNVNFDDFNAAVEAMVGMPSLRSLYISMDEEDQVDLIIRKLPHLEFLNGLPVERDGNEEPEASAVNTI